MEATAALYHWLHSHDQDLRARRGTGSSIASASISIAFQKVAWNIKPQSREHTLKGHEEAGKTARTGTGAMVARPQFLHFIFTAAVCGRTATRTAARLWMDAVLRLRDRSSRIWCLR